MIDTENLGGILAKARRTGRKLDAYPVNDPFDLKTGLEVQSAMIRAMGADVVGWKIGLTSTIAQKAMGLDAPIAGPLFRDLVLEDGASLQTADHDLRIIEAEIAFVMGSDLTPRGTPYTREEVVAAIATAHPAFELVNTRLPGGLMHSAGWIAADGTVNQALVLGQGVGFDPMADYAAETVEVRQDGQSVSRGSGANALGDPLGVMAWVANHLSARKIGLNAGDVVSTGLICDLLSGAPGQTFEARFASLGSVRLNLS